MPERERLVVHRFDFVAADQPVEKPKAVTTWRRTYSRYDRCQHVDYLDNYCRTLARYNQNWPRDRDLPQRLCQRHYNLLVKRAQVLDDFNI